MLWTFDTVELWEQCELGYRDYSAGILVSSLYLDRNYTRDGVSTSIEFIQSITWASDWIFYFSHRRACGIDDHVDTRNHFCYLQYCGMFVA